MQGRCRSPGPSATARSGTGGFAHELTRSDRLWLEGLLRAYEPQKMRHAGAVSASR